MSKFTVHEKRQYKRRDVELETKIDVLHRGKTETVSRHEARILNICEGGLLFETHQHIGIGSTLIVHVTLESTEEEQIDLSLLCSVVWSMQQDFDRPYRIGVIFDEASGDAFENWKAFVQRN